MRSLSAVSHAAYVGAAVAAVLASALPTSATAQSAPRPLTVDDMFSVQRVGGPQVSPEGDWVAYTVSTTSLEDERSTTRVWMVPATGGDPIPLTAQGKSASSPDWSPDGRYLTFLAARDGDRTQVWALDRRGGEALPLPDVEQGAKGSQWSPDGTRLLLTIRDPEEKDEDRKENAPEDPWVIDRLEFKRDGTGYLTGDRHTHLYVFDVPSRELRQLTTGRWDEGQAEWSPDGTKVAFVSTRTPDPDAEPYSDVWVVDAGLAEPTDAPLRITRNPGSDGSPAWSPDGRWIAYTTTTDVDAIWYATAHLAVTASDGSGEPRVLTRELDRNPSDPRWSEDGSYIWFGLEDSAEDHLVRIRPDGTGMERMVAGPLSAGGFDWAGGTFAFQVSTLDRPAEIFALDDRGARRRLTNHNAWLDAIDMGETRNIHFTSADGTAIEGFAAFPPGYDPDAPGRQRLPLILRIHGGPVSQYTHSFNFEARMFAADGYVVVYTNPRGSSGYGQAFSQAIFADWGNKDFQDVMAGVDHAVAQGWADPDRLGVGGWSYGGILTNYVITQTGRFKGAISGASEVLYIANYGHDHYQFYWEKELGLPWEGDNRATWERISPFNKAHLVTTPTLIMGGERDWNVPIQNSEQLYQVLRRKGIPTQLVVYPGQGHGLAVPSYQKDRYQRYLEWYAKWVKGAEKPVT